MKFSLSTIKVKMGQFKGKQCILNGTVIKSEVNYLLIWATVGHYKKWVQFVIICWLFVGIAHVS